MADEQMHIDRLSYRCRLPAIQIWGSVTGMPLLSEIKPASCQVWRRQHAFQPK